MSKYSDKLRDPRWQKRRLEIMQRDNFMCRECYDSTKMLAVHHRYYVPGREPWEYPDFSLCHALRGLPRTHIKRGPTMGEVHWASDG